MKSSLSPIGSAALSGFGDTLAGLVITDLYFDKTRRRDWKWCRRPAHQPAGGRHSHHRLRHDRNGRRGDEERRLRLPGEAVQGGRAEAVRAARALLQHGPGRTGRAVSETNYLRKQLRKKYEFSQIIGSSPKMQEVFKMIERVADTDSTILILGESGTGKELVARALHFNSRRQFAPFVPVNCSALPENLLESELFGHRRGAFTGAINDKKGLFQEADGGTIFLDEVGSMSALLQSRLLRVLQEREVRRVGENTPIYVNVRVVAASNEPLEKRIKEGTFREDLYYR